VQVHVCGEVVAGIRFLKRVAAIIAFLPVLDMQQQRQRLAVVVELVEIPVFEALGNNGNLLEIIECFC
jgi:hypothetical protein